MMNRNELLEIKGGGISAGLGLLLGGIVTFLIGVFDGLFRLKWQEHKNIASTGNSKERLFIQMSQEDAIMFIK